MVTGQVVALVLAISTSLPCRSWSVLLLGILILICAPSNCTSQALVLASSSKRKKPKKASGQGDVSQGIILYCILGNGLDHFFSNGSSGLAKILFRLSMALLTKELSAGDSTHTREWAHAKAFTASSTAALDDLDSARCCRYRTTSTGLAGNAIILCSVAHSFHLRPLGIFWL